MTKAVWAPVVGLALVATILSGCLSEGELDLDGLQAPVWEPGFRWSYDVEATASHTFLAEGGRATQSFEYATGINSTVINTSGTINDLPAYFVTQETDMDDGFYGMEFGMFGGGGVVALTQDTLQPVARASPWHWQQDCGVIQMYPVDEPAMLDFPLTLGSTWGGEFDHAEYAAEVIGVESVKTDAGTFDAVHVRVVVTPIFDEPEAMPVEEPMPADAGSGDTYDYEVAERETLEEAEFTQDYWYAPSARNLVKTVTSGHSVMTRGDERYETNMASTTTLTDFSLIPGEEQPAPTLVSQGPRSFRQDSLQIVTDTALPYNLANGTTTARFGVERLTPEPITVSNASHGGGPVREVSAMSVPVHGEIRLVDSVPDVGEFDHEAYELRWSIYMMDGGHDEFVGDVLELELDGPAIYDLNAELRPVVDHSPVDDDCRYMLQPMRWVMPAYGQAKVFFEKEYEVSVDAGPAVEIDLGTIPVGGGYPQFVATWSIDSHSEMVRDQSFPVLSDPAGHEYYPDSPGHGYHEDWLDGEASGDWTLLWRAEGPSLVPAGTPVVVGHDAVLSVRIDPSG